MYLFIYLFNYLFIYLQGAEPCLFSWTKQANQRKAPRERKIDESNIGVAASAVQIGACPVLPSNNALTDVAGSFLWLSDKLFTPLTTTGQSLIVVFAPV